MPTLPRKCARCRTHATHQARRHGVTIPMCPAHHATVWQGLVADGWIVSSIDTRAKVPA